MKVLPDLLILDYLTFNHDIFNVYDYMDNLNIKVPLIFYNDPCLLRSTRALHWKTQLELTQARYPKRDFSTYEPLLNELEALIEAKEFKPYISLLQAPQKVPASLIREKYTLQYPGNLFFLLSVLQEYKNLELSYNDIAEIYEKKGKHITKESLKVLMSKLKKIIHQDKECNFLIYHDKDRYQFVRYKV